MDIAQHRRAEMGGGAAERRRQVPMRQRRPEHVEQRRVFEGEAARQPGIAGVVDDEAPLQTGGSGRRLRKSLGGAAELVGVGHVLGVVDHEAGAAGQRQGDVERPRLGARQAGRAHHHLEPSRHPDLGEGRRGLGIVGLDHELDIELGRWVVAVLCSNLTQKR